MRLIPTLALVGVALASPRLARSQESQPWDRAAIYALLDRLDPLDTTNLTFGRVEISGHAARPADHETRFGFLRSDDGATFRVHLADLSDATFHRTPRGTHRAHRSGWDPYDLRTFAHAMALRLRGEPEPPDRAPLFSPDSPPASGTAWVIARACARRGLAAEAAELGDAAAQVQDGQDANPTHWLEAWAEQACRKRLIEPFSDLTIPRPELLSRVRAHQRRFAGAQRSIQWSNAPALDTLAEGLASLVAEDDAWTHGDRPAANDALDREVLALIHALRDETLERAFLRDLDRGSGGPRRTPPVAPLPDRASERLVALGFAAVPHLLEAMADERPSRALTSIKGVFGDRAWPTSIGSIAAGILAEIRGRPALGLDHAHAILDFRSSWEEAQREPETDYLAACVSEEVSSSVLRFGAVRRLLKRAAPRALRALEAAFQPARGIRGLDVIPALVESRAPGTLAFLVRALDAARFAADRLALARAVFDLGSTDAVATLERALRDALARPSRIEAGDLIALLAECAPSANVARLIDHVGAIDDDQLHHRLIGGLASRDPAIDALPSRRADARPALTATIEDLLIAGLPDLGSVSRPGTREFTTASVSRLCARALATRWPDRYTFDLLASEPVQRRQIEEIEATWRAVHRDKSDAPPSAPAIDHLAAAVHAAIDRLASRQGQPSRDAAAADLVRIGPAAYADLEELLDSLADGDPARLVAEDVLARIATTVSAASVPPTADAVTAVGPLVHAMEGRPLDPAGCADVLSSLAATRIAAGTYAVISIARDGVTGQIQVAFELAAATRPIMQPLDPSRPAQPGDRVFVDGCWMGAFRDPRDLASARSWVRGEIDRARSWLIGQPYLPDQTRVGLARIP